MIISLIKKKLLYLQCQTDKYMFNKRKSMPTKEEVKTAYRNLNRVIKAISEDKDIPEWKKIPLIDKLLDRNREIQIWLFDYLDDEDFENKV